MNADELAARLRETFRAELEDQLRAADGHVLALERSPADTEELRGLFRVMHTLKGAARAAGFETVEHICHDAEASLAAVRDAHRPIAPGELAELFHTIDALRATSVDADDGPGEAAPEPVRPATAPTQAANDRTTQHSAAPRPDANRADASVRVAAERLDSLLFASNRLLIAAGQSAGEAESIDALRDGLQRFAVRLRARRASANVGADEAADEDDAQIRALLNAAASASTLSRDTARALGVVSDDLSRGIRVLRLRPFEDATDRLRRMVHDVAAAMEKQVELVVSGEDVSADRGIVELLREALLHLVRNAVDHGIESPGERRSAGKPESGTITIRAVARGDRMIATVHDDGRGIDVAALRRELARRGEPADGDDRSIVQRVLTRSGVSTKGAASEISGRGVGLDAARAAILRARGDLTVDWQPGHGTTFTIDVPLTLTTIRAVLGVMGDTLVAIPSVDVERLVRVRVADLLVSEGRTAIPTAAGPAPLVAVAGLVGAAASDVTGDVVHAAIVATAQGRQIAFALDALDAELELVVRPIRAQGSAPARHVSGAAVLPDGRIALVLNMSALLHDAMANSTDTIRLTPKAERARRRRVLVVDDSITTRTLEQSVLEAAGYEVDVAADGADGWRRLQERGADAVVADVEMPRMDGLALCRAVRAAPRFQDLPFVLITGLESDADRRAGMEAGADAYLGKSSFEQAALVDVLQNLLGS